MLIIHVVIDPFQSPGECFNANNNSDFCRTTNDSVVIHGRARRAQSECILGHWSLNKGDRLFPDRPAGSRIKGEQADLLIGFDQEIEATVDTKWTAKKCSIPQVVMIDSRVSPSHPQGISQMKVR